MASIRAAIGSIFGIRNRRGGPAGKYTALELDQSAIERGEHKKHLGGGAAKWESRGRFQLNLLCASGLRPSHRFIDIGCGPLRAGEHFIRHLERENYCGIDYSEALIKAAEHTVAGAQDLLSKSPTLKVVKNFDFAGLGTFDFAIAFSVLNHCDRPQRDLFLENVRDVLSPGGKIFISHAQWMTPADIEKSGLTVARVYEGRELDLVKYGWPAGEIKPGAFLYELMRD